MGVTSGLSAKPRPCRRSGRLGTCGRMPQHAATSPASQLPTGTTSVHLWRRAKPTNETGGSHERDAESLLCAGRSRGRVVGAPTRRSLPFLLGVTSRTEIGRPCAPDGFPSAWRSTASSGPPWCPRTSRGWSTRRSAPRWCGRERRQGAPSVHGPRRRRRRAGSHPAPAARCPRVAGDLGVVGGRPGVPRVAADGPSVGEAGDRARVHPRARRRARGSALNPGPFPL